MNGWLIAAAAGGGWLAGARSWFGLLTWRGWAQIRVRTEECEHGWRMIDRGKPCHPVVVEEGATQAWRVTLALLWPLMAVPWLIYLTVTRGQDEASGMIAD